MNSATNNRPQVSSLRSRRGCITCRQKKVKCDEQHPLCGRCGRLRLVCDWPKPDQTTSEKRRREKETWAPKRILPNVQPTPIATSTSSHSTSTTELPVPKDECFNNLAPTDWEDWFLGQEPTPGLNARTEGPLELISLEESMNQDFSFVLDEPFQFEFTPSVPSSLRHIWDISNANLGLTSPLDMMTPSSQGHCIAFSSNFEFTRNEHRALHHYQHIFSKGQTTKKNTPWTTLGAILSLGSSVPMVMHLLIAASLLDIAACYEYDPQISYVAQQHFRAGAQLLTKSMTEGIEPDHASILAAFYFIHCYMTKHKEIDVPALCQLSKAVLKHIERYDLDLYCAGTLLPQQAASRSPGVPALSKNNRSFLARMVIWLFYKDVIGCSMGYGGAFASYMTAHGDRMKDIYQMSTTALESFWGNEYPVMEVIDDVENAAVIEFLHEVLTCFQFLNEYYANPEAKIYKKDEVEQRIAVLEQKARTVIRLAAITTVPRSQLLKTADFSISCYYALLIFHHLHKLSLNNSMPPLPSSAALTPLLIVAQRTFASEDNRHYERYFWPLFLAGIETEDAIHREWIMGKIEDRRMRRALERICLVQERIGRRVEMKLVKKLLCGKRFSIIPVAELGFS